LWDFLNEQLTQLTNDGANYVSAAVSLTGTKIVAVREVSGGVDLMLLDRENVGEGQVARSIVLTDNRGEVLEGDVEFATDGTRIIYSAATNGNGDIMMMDMTTYNISPVITSEANEIYPHYSPDNRYIVYSANPTGVFNLFVLDTIALQTYQLTEQTREPVYAAGWYN
jgi:Tol biopolymer transport system component